MKRTGIKTFACLRKPLKIPKEKQKMTTVNIDRQLFSRFVVVSEKREIDLQEVHSHELAQVPLSLANLDRTLRKTSKSVLLKKLDIDGQATQTLPSTDSSCRSVYLIDLMALVQMTRKGTHAHFW